MPDAVELVWAAVSLLLYLAFIGGIAYGVVHYSRRGRRRDETLQDFEKRLVRLEQKDG